MCINTYNETQEKQEEFTKDIKELFVRYKQDILQEELTELEIVEDFINCIKDLLETEENEKYNYNKENFKICPICDKKIDYCIDGFYHDKILNIWICRKHKLTEIQNKIKLQDKDLLEFIREQEQ